MATLFLFILITTQMQFTCPYCNRTNDVINKQFIRCPACYKIATNKNGHISAPPPTSSKVKVIVIAALICTIAGCYKLYTFSNSPSTVTNVQTVAREATPAQKLVTVDFKESETSPPDNEVVRIAQEHLTTLSQVFGESEADIANHTYIASQQLQRKGLHYRAIDLLRIAANSTQLREVKKAGISYTEFITMVVTLTTKDEGQ